MPGFSKKLLFSLKNTVVSSKDTTPQKLLIKLHSIEDKALPIISTNPIAKNALAYVFHNLKINSVSELKALLIQRINLAINHLSTSFDKIAFIGSKKIKKGMVVFVHGNSDSVINTLIRAKKDGINFEVHCTEEKPSYEGKELAATLAKNKIPVKFYADLAARQAIKRADLVLMGAKVIAANNQIYGRIGSELIADIAERYDVPVYICADSWKFSKSVSYELDKSRVFGSEKELWSNPQKGICIINYNFEKIHPWLIVGIITEEGIFKPHHLIYELKKINPWMS